MKIPHGESNFKKVVTKDFLYIDKTAYIATLEEQGSFNILLRPRRFGKSLFLSSLHYYYDIACKDEFSDIFGNLHIGRHPTPERNSYRILLFDFSGICTDSFATIMAGFTTRVAAGLEKYRLRYQYSRRDREDITSSEMPADMLARFFTLVNQDKIYCLIDEYDHFANAILGDDPELFKQVVGKGGFVRAFYETIKTATRDGIVARLFITGITSLTLDSMTSGFNIGKNLTHHKEFNQALGFTRQELEIIIQPLVDACELDRQELLDKLAQWYNGYCFNILCPDLIFNPSMVLYFMDSFDIRDCRFPEQMLDENIASDYGKIMKLFSVGDREQNYQVLEELIINGQTLGRHSRRIDLDKGFDRDDFISLLLYMGFITIQGRELTRLRYGIPNYVIQRLYFAYFRVELERRSRFSISTRKIEDAMAAMALENNINPLAQEIRSVLALFSNRDFMQMDEKHIKAVILTLLYQSEVYFIKSEPEVNNRYPDILLLERSPYKVNFQFLIELKYVKKKEGKKGWHEKKEQGIRQVQQYLRLDELACLANLRTYLLLTNGSDLEVVAVEPGTIKADSMVSQ